MGWRKKVAKDLKRLKAELHEFAYDLYNGKDRTTLLVDACKAGKWKKVAKWLNLKHSQGTLDCALRWACGLGHVEAAKLLIKHGANVQSRGENGSRWTSLHWASHMGMDRVVQFLLSAKADVSVKDDAQRTPLQLAQEAAQNPETLNPGHEKVILLLQAQLLQGNPLKTKTRQSCSSPSSSSSPPPAPPGACSASSSYPSTPVSSASSSSSSAPSTPSFSSSSTSSASLPVSSTVLQPVNPKSKAQERQATVQLLRLEAQKATDAEARAEKALTVAQKATADAEASAEKALTVAQKAATDAEEARAETERTKAKLAELQQSIERQQPIPRADVPLANAEKRLSEHETLLAPRTFHDLLKKVMSQARMETKELTTNETKQRSGSEKSEAPQVTLQYFDKHLKLLNRLLPTIPSASLVVQGPLGSGSSGTVLRARHEGSVVAWKMPKGESEKGESEKRRAQLKAEAEIAMLCPPHPNVVTPLAFVENEDHDFAGFTLAFWDGNNLELKHTHLEQAQVISAACQIATGLAHLHAYNIVHRDLAPRNILVSPDRTKYAITDFGISRPTGYLRYPGSDVGLPWQILAPEIHQFEMDNESTDHSGCPFREASDIWALGITLWELATHRHAYAQADPKKIKRDIANGSAKLPMHELLLNNPKLVPTILACLQHEPENRPSAVQVLYMLKMVNDI